MLAGVAAAAPASCPTGTTISNTGTGSTNTIACNTTSSTRVTCVNNIYVVGQNGQTATSGSSSTSGNTTGGATVSGSATNDNNQNVQVGATCNAAATTTKTTTTPTKPTAATLTTPAPTPAPSTSTTVGTTPVAAKAASLPETGSNSIIATSGIAVALLGATVAVSRLGVFAYRRATLK